MKQFFTILILLNFTILISSSANGIYSKENITGGNSKAINLFVAGTPNITQSQVSMFENEFEKFIQQVASKKQKYRSESKFLEYVFYKTHRKFLKNYQLYSSFADLIKDENYDCVTGTALYALILKKLDIEYTIKEFDYHVLLIAKTDSKQVLFESTDPLNGFVNDKSEIQKRIKFYAQQGEGNQSFQSIGAKEKLSQQSYSVHNNIDLEQLVGLQYYNMAVKSYTHSDFVQAIQHLEKGLNHYNSNRFQQFATIILDNLEDDSSVSAEKINHYMNKYKRDTFAKQ